jgi:hypothetical protein
MVFYRLMLDREVLGYYDSVSHTQMIVHRVGGLYLDVRTSSFWYDRARTSEKLSLGIAQNLENLLRPVVEGLRQLHQTPADAQGFPLKNIFLERHAILHAAERNVLASLPPAPSPVRR